MDIPLDLVSASYKTDRETEKFLDDGSQLKDGMIVLIYSENLRRDAKNESPGEKERVFRSNRWAKVSDFKIRSGYSYRKHLAIGDGASVLKTKQLITFLATYGDGTTEKRLYSITHPWLVKIDSIPEGN